MNVEQIDSLNFAIHIILLGSKLWLCYFLWNWFTVLQTPKKENYMIIYNTPITLLLIFSIGYVGYEVYFIGSFFLRVDLYLYEYYAMSDQIVMTLVSVKLMIKEKS